MGVLGRMVGAMALVVLAQGLTQLSVLAASPPPNASDEMTFVSPDEGIVYFTSALQQVDAPAALRAFSIEGRVSGLNFLEMGKRLRAVLLMNGYAPERFEFYEDANRAKVRGEAALQLRNLAYSLLLPPDTDLQKTILYEKGDDVDALVSEVEAQLDPSRLRSLKLLRTGITMPEIQRSERFKEIKAGRMRASGGDDLQEWIALYDMDGVTLMAGFTFVRYGDRWQILALGSDLANTPVNGPATPQTEASFLDLIK